MFFDKLWFHNIILPFILFYMLSSILFVAHFANCDKTARPLLFQSFSLFSVFFVGLCFWLFCFEFTDSDKFYFFGQNFQLIFLFFFSFVLLCSYDFLTAKKILKYEYDFLLFFVLFSGVCLCYSSEFLMVYLVIEIQSLTFYIFATFFRNSEYSTEAGLKYFIFGGVISCFLLLGISLTYLFFGSVTFELIVTLLNTCNASASFLAFFFILIVLMFKVGCAPFHFWLCDVYEGAILSVTLLFASAPKIVLFSLFFKLCFFVFFEQSNFWSNFLGFSGLFSICLGSICAIYQKRLKRLFAYSTIAHTGFILLAFLCLSFGSLKSLVFYIVVYTTLTITTFAILINAATSVKFQPKYLINFSGIGSKNHIFAAVFALTLLAVAGIPPLAGFFSKFFILISVIGAQYVFVALSVVFFSTIACFYYLRLVKIAFFVNVSKNIFWLTNKKKQNVELVICSSLFFICFYFLRPNLLMGLSIVISLTLL